MRRIDPRTDDLGPLAVLHAASFAGGWSEKFLRDLLAMPGVFAFEHGGGFVLARVASNEAEILTLAVAPAARRKGSGRRLVQQAALHAESLGADTLFLEVGIDNLAALTLYDGLGFKAMGRRKAYYGDQDAHILKVALPLPKA
jgi:[ribosomal protein S18]-alanine N-acetyltransferase